jgi:hypothetical protein
MWQMAALAPRAACSRPPTWHPPTSGEEQDEVAFGLVFREIAPSLEVWLTTWLDAPPMTPQVATLHSSMVEMARESRARIAAMTPEQRAAMGLPESGWEQVVWGGIGLEPDQPNDAA